MAEGFVILFLISFCFFLYDLYKIANNLYRRKRAKEMDTIGAMIAGLIITLLIYLAIALYGFVSFFEDLEHMLSG